MYIWVKGWEHILPAKELLSETHLYRYAHARVPAFFIGGDYQPQGVADHEQYQSDPDASGALLVLYNHVGRGPYPSCTQYRKVGFGVQTILSALPSAVITC